MQHVLLITAMASKLKKQKFDPSAQKQRFISQKNIGSMVKGACTQFLDAIRKAGKGVPFADPVPSTHTELVLVSMFGLRGVSPLKSAISVLPSELCIEDRVQYISNVVIVEQDTPPILSVPDTLDVIRSFIPHSDKVVYFHKQRDVEVNLLYAMRRTLSEVLILLSWCHPYHAA